MVKYDFANADVGTMNSTQEEFVVNSYNTDGAGEQEETEYQNTEWPQQWAYFNEIPELKQAVIMKAIWDVGKGWDADPITKAELDHIKGWGKDTFDDILFNMQIQMYIGGDAYAQIIRDSDTGKIINIKPLDPGTIVIYADQNGIIKRYEQTSKVKGKKPKKFEPNEMLHLSHNRIADQIHGISVIKSLESVIKAEGQSFEDMTKIMRRQAKPLIVFKLKTDNTAQIASLISKVESAVNKGEHLYVPDDENILSYEVVQVNVSEVVLAWRTDVRNKFYRGLGLPLIIFGNAGTTESGGKIEYLAHEQVFSFAQRRIEQQYWAQAQLRFKLISPVTLLENLQNDEAKDQQNALRFQPAEMMTGPMPMEEQNGDK